MPDTTDLHYFRPDWVQKSDQTLTADLIVYGGTSAGVIAAVEAARRNLSVVILHPGKFLGGLTSGGLGWTDFGKQHVIGGLAREFYRRVGQHYGKAEEWYFEPKVASAVYAALVKEHNIPVHFCQYLDQVQKTGTQVVEITMLGGLKAKGKVFVDATYEGDLMAKAGVSYHVGREANEVYGETLNGIQVRGHHQFVPATVSPYVKENDPSSGLLPYIVNEDLTKKQGQGDKRVQAYNFRVCMTDDPALKIEWPKPDDFDPALYVLATRWFNGEKDDYNEQIPGFKKTPDLPRKFDAFPNRTPGGFLKTDTNNHGPVSSDFIGANHEWPDGCYETREKLFQAHVSYQQGLYWHLANSPEIPDRYRKAYGRWGLSKDEFTTCGGWSCQLYVREARRMVADYLVTEHDCTHARKCEDPVAMGSYNLDSHNCCRFVNADGKVLNDGDVQVPPAGPYGISYRAVIPKAQEATNLFVPVCCATSHIAYGSVRMEPVFMALGQSCAVAAALAIKTGSSVQQVKYAELEKQLLELKQVLRI
jgi:hypothetical protein